MNLNKIFANILLANMVMVILVGQALPKNPVNLEVLKNLTYTIYPSKDKPTQVTLVNGRDSRIDSPENLIMTQIGKIATGDLNDDGKDDAAVLLFSNYGGSGTFGELAVVVIEDGILEQVASAFLGDRVVIQSLAIENGVISVHMLTHGPKDPMAAPTLRRTERFKLVDNKLVKQ